MKLLPVIFFILFVSQLSAQQGQSPFIRNFEPSEYKAVAQIWAINQDKNGIMYFGNSEGLSVYDGSAWQFIKLKIIRSIAIDNQNQIYINFDNDFGYLKADSKGRLQYNSLKPLLPEKQRDIQDFRDVIIYNDKIIYRATDKLLIYEHGNFQIIHNENKFGKAFVINNQEAR